MVRTAAWDTQNTPSILKPSGTGWVMIGSENVAELQENWTVTVRALRAWLVDTKMGMTLISLHDSCWHVGEIHETEERENFRVFA